MSGSSLASADAILKELYVGPIVEMLNQKTYLIDQIEKDSDHIDHTGRRAVFPVHKSRNRGRGSRGDGGTLPAAKKQGWQDGQVYIRYHYLGIELTDGEIEASKSNEGAFISLLDAECKGAATDMRKDMNRQCFGEGNGLLCNVATSAKGVVIKVADPSEMQYIQIEDTIDIVKVSNGKVEGKGIENVEVVSRNVEKSEFEISTELAAEVKTSDKFGVFVHGNYTGAGSTLPSGEMDGLRNMTAKNRTLHNINSETAGNAYWNGQFVKVGTSGLEPSVAAEASFIKLATLVGQQGNGDVEVFLTTRGVRDRLASSYTSQKRWTNAEAVDVHGGYSAIMVNEVPVIADDDCPKQFAFGFNKSAFKFFEQTAPSWLQQGDGDIFQKKIVESGGGVAAAWQAWFRWYVSFACVAPNRTGRLEFLTDDEPV